MTKTNSAYSGISASQKIPHSLAVKKLLLRLSKAALVDVVLIWLKNLPLCAPYVPDQGDEDEEPLTVEELKEIYEQLKSQNSKSRRAVVERITDMDWKDGLNLWQIAQLDCRILLEHPMSQKWSAQKLILQSSGGGPANKEIELPRFLGASFIHTLGKILEPFMRCYFYLFRHPQLPLHILRMQIYDMTGNLAVLPAPKHIMFCAFPENSPYVFVSVGAKDGLRDVVFKSIAPAISRPGQRYEIIPTALTTKSLSGMTSIRSSKGANALGAWSLYADDKIDHSPLQNTLSTSKETTPSIQEDATKSKRRKIAEARFGTSAKEGDGNNLERFVVNVKDKFTSMEDEDSDQEEFKPLVTIKFEGSHVFAGIRKLVEEGTIDGLKMPSWMTGEDGVSLGTIDEGQMLKRK